MDVIGLAIIVPVLMLAIDGNFLEKSAKLRWVYKTLNFATEGSFLLFMVVLVLAYFIFKNFLSLYHIRAMTLLVRKCITNISEIRFRQLLNKKDVQLSGTPELINQVNYFPYYYATGVMLPFMNLITETVVILCVLIALLFYKPLAFLLIIAVMAPAFYFINRIIRKRIYKIGQDGAALREETISTLNLGNNGLFEVKFNQAEDFFIRRFIRKQAAYFHNELKVYVMQSVPSRTNEIIALFGVIILVVYGFFFSNYQSEIRVLGAMFVLAVFRMLPASNRLLASLVYLKNHQHIVESLIDTEMSKGNLDVVNRKPFDKFLMTNISYSFNEENAPLFSGATVSIKKGEIVGLFGPSGSGKTTLSRIIAGAITPLTGQIFLNSRPLQPEEAYNWKKRVSIVNQNPFIFKGNIVENIAFEDTNIDKVRLKEAINNAYLQQFLNAQGEPDENLQIGEMGVTLSEGQKQRLAIARAFYKNADLIILDEGTNSLDVEAEEIILDTIKRLSEKGISFFIIAHNPKLMSICTTKYQLAEGKLKEL